MYPSWSLFNRFSDRDESYLINQENISRNHVIILSMKPVFLVYILYVTIDHNLADSVVFVLKISRAAKWSHFSDRKADAIYRGCWPTDAALQWG